MSTAPLHPRKGRNAIVDAGAGLFAEADLDDLMSGFGPRMISAASNLSPGTVTHHFPNGASELRRAVLQRAIERVGLEVTAEMAERVDKAGSMIDQTGDAALDEIALALRRELETYSPDDWIADPKFEAFETAGYLASAVAPRNSYVKQTLLDLATNQHRLTVSLSRHMLELTHRRWNEDVSEDSFATTINSLAAGFLLLRRADRIGVSLELYSETVIRIFEACTTRLARPDRTDYRSALLETAQRSNLDMEKRRTIIDAAIRVYERDGWLHVNTVSVAKEADVSRPTVVANFRDSNGLAAAVWAMHLAQLRRVAERSRTLPLIQGVQIILENFAEAARRDIDLTTAFLEGVFAYTMLTQRPPEEGDPVDPRNLVPLPTLLIPVIASGAELLREGNAGSPLEIVDTASLLTNHCLHLAMTRLSLSSSEVASRICNTTLSGMLKSRRPQ